MGHQPARLDQRKRARSATRSTRPPGNRVLRRARKLKKGDRPLPDLVLCLRLQVHAGDGAAAEPGRRPSRGLSQRALRRAAAAARANDSPPLRRARAPSPLPHAPRKSRRRRRSPPVAGRSRCRSSPSTISTAISKRRTPVEVTEPDGSKHKIVTGGAAHLAAALGGAARRPCQHDHRLGRRHDRRFAADLGQLSRRADDRCDEPAWPRVQFGRQS